MQDLPSEINPIRGIPTHEELQDTGGTLGDLGVDGGGFTPTPTNILHKEDKSGMAGHGMDHVAGGSMKDVEVRHKRGEVEPRRHKSPRARGKINTSTQFSDETTPEEFSQEDHALVMLTANIGKYSGQMTGIVVVEWTEPGSDGRHPRSK